jgi:hypothetical protein
MEPCLQFEEKFQKKDEGVLKCGGETIWARIFKSITFWAKLGQVGATLCRFVPVWAKVVFFGFFCAVLCRFGFFCAALVFFVPFWFFLCRFGFFCAVLCRFGFFCAALVFFVPFCAALG